MARSRLCNLLYVGRGVGPLGMPDIDFRNKSPLRWGGSRVGKSPTRGAPCGYTEATSVTSSGSLCVSVVLPNGPLVDMICSIVLDQILHSSHSFQEGHPESPFQADQYVRSFSDSAKILGELRERELSLRTQYVARP